MCLNINYWNKWFFCWNEDKKDTIVVRTWGDPSLAKLKKSKQETDADIHCQPSPDSKTYREGMEQKTDRVWKNSYLNILLIFPGTKRAAKKQKYFLQLQRKLLCYHFIP